MEGNNKISVQVVIIQRFGPVRMTRQRIIYEEDFALPLTASSFGGYVYAVLGIESCARRLITASFWTWMQVLIFRQCQPFISTNRIVSVTLSAQDK